VSKPTAGEMLGSSARPAQRRLNTALAIYTMPFYRVRLEGTGILLPTEGAEEPAIGFFTTRQVRAADETDAKLRALAVVADEWSTDPYASSNKGASPSLSVEEVWRVSWWHALLRGSMRGHAFYSNP
jgi:hypothetical protein